MNGTGKSARYAALEEIIEAMKQGELGSVKPKAVAIEVEPEPVEAMAEESPAMAEEMGETMDPEVVDPEKRAALEDALRAFLK